MDFPDKGANMCLNEKLKEYIENRSGLTTPDHPIYHYTEEKNYSEILRCEYLKLNSHLFLNKKDKTNQELHAGVMLIIDELKNDEELCYLTETFERFISRGIVYYTLSFSVRRSISLANKYGKYCIEFDPKLFKQFQQNHPSTLFSRVEYDVQKRKKIIKDIFDIYKSCKNDDESIFFLIESLTTVIPLFKGEEHKNDDECRVVQAEIFSPNDGKLATPLVSKKVPFAIREIISVYRE